MNRSLDTKNLSSLKHKLSFAGTLDFRQSIVVILSVVLCLFHLYTGMFGVLNAFLQRLIHLALTMSLVFLVVPRKKGAKKSLDFIDLIFMICLIMSVGYLWKNSFYLVQDRLPLITPVTLGQKILGVMLLVVVLEACRRTLGMPMVWLALFFMVYAFVGPFLPGKLGFPRQSFSLFIDYQYLTLYGIFGVPLGVSATYIILFVLFGNILNATGFGEFLVDASIGAFGKTRGGPAKVAVVASALMGTISGSSSANVLTTGTFTIPMMKGLGYEPHFAGAVEAAASTGGQIMPPIMAATAFLMAEFLGIPYATVMRYAILPAILYFSGILFAVDLEAAKLGLGGLSDEDLPQWKKQLPLYAHLFIPIIVLVVLMMLHYTPLYAITNSTLLLVLLGLARKSTRLSLRAIVDVLVETAQGVLGIASACATAGIIIGIVVNTGIAVKFTSMIATISGGIPMLALILSMLGAIVLGMGLPTTAAYVMQVALIVPALINLGLSPAQAHMFALYYACMSMITPPVAVTSYAAATVAGADMNKTGWTAVKLAASAFIVPFMFAYAPQLMLIGSLPEIILAAATAFLGVYALSAALQGFWVRRLTFVQRVLVLAGSLLLIFPGWTTDCLGLALAWGVFVWQRLSERQ